ncbi:MAG TPA: hypothetical protein VMW28_04940, partial [Pelolinea sp.]|nr:hypothetical protein [Pelolinea sp.]
MIFKEAHFNKISEILLADHDEYGEIYLVGGYIRDSMAGRQTHDFDFVVRKNSINAARKIADLFNGDYYVMDKERQMARAIIQLNYQEKTFFDFSILNRGEIISDLKNRDFTINAIAVNLSSPGKLIDPLGGIDDLEKRRLNPCDNDAFNRDPVRTLRSVRFIQSFNLDYTKKTRNLILNAARGLKNVSAERVRDEICQIFSLETFSGSLDMLKEFNVLNEVFPEIPSLLEIPANPPHVHNAYDHTIRVVEIMHLLISFIRSGILNSSNPFLKSAILIIGKYKNDLIEYVNRDLTPGRGLDIICLFAALYHDVAKGFIEPQNTEGKVSFPGHSHQSAEIAARRARS